MRISSGNSSFPLINKQEIDFGQSYAVIVSSGRVNNYSLLTISNCVYNLFFSSLLINYKTLESIYLEKLQNKFSRMNFWSHFQNSNESFQLTEVISKTFKIRVICKWLSSETWKRYFLSWAHLLKIRCKKRRLSVAVSIHIYTCKYSIDKDIV